MAESEVSFINYYVGAWNIATTNGFTSLTSIGGGNGLMAFNNAVEDLAVEQACAYGIFDSDGQTFLEGLKSYFSAKRFCWTSGNKDNYEYDYDM